MNALDVAKKMEIDSIKFYTEAAVKTQYPEGLRLLVTPFPQQQFNARSAGRTVHQALHDQRYDGFGGRPDQGLPLARYQGLFAVPT